MRPAAGGSSSRFECLLKPWTRVFRLFSGCAAQSAAAQPLGYSVGEDADSSLSGTLYLFSPSSTTYVKNYYATTQYQFKNSIGTLEAIESFVGGYFNTTSVVDAVRFQMTSGNMDGEIKMYGLL